MTRGAVVWLLQSQGPHLFFEGQDSDPVFRVGIGTYHRGSLDMIPTAVRDTPDQPREPIFSTVVCITLWCIWKARCLHVLSDQYLIVAYLLRLIWSELATP